LEIAINKASSHVGADDKKRTIGEFVRRPYSAWTVGRHANPISLNMELCAFASWTLAEWNKHPNMLENCAMWIAEEAKQLLRFRLPSLRRLKHRAREKEFVSIEISESGVGVIMIVVMVFPWIEFLRWPEVMDWRMMNWVIQTGIGNGATGI
jgi:hypothetical protein